MKNLLLTTKMYFYWRVKKLGFKTTDLVLPFDSISYNMMIAPDLIEYRGGIYKTKKIVNKGFVSFSLIKVESKPDICDLHSFKSFRFFYGPLWGDNLVDEYISKGQL